MSRRIRRISAVMHEKLESSDEVRMRAEREMEMTTELLAGASVTEPKIFSINTGLILKTFLLTCTVQKLVIIMDIYLSLIMIF